MYFYPKNLMDDYIKNKSIRPILIIIIFIGRQYPLKRIVYRPVVLSYPDEVLRGYRIEKQRF